VNIEWFKDHGFKIEQMAPNVVPLNTIPSFYIVVYVRFDERIGITAEELVKERIKSHQEEIVDQLEDKNLLADVLVVLMDGLKEEEQDETTMYYQQLYIIAKNDKATFKVVKKTAITYSVEELNTYN
jgi:hypothetical protein